MLTLTTMIFILVALAIMVIMAASLMSKKMIIDREKSSPFECGFDPFSSSRIPFSLRFFMITIIFLIFDVEIAIILPLPLIMSSMESMIWSMITSIFMITLILGIIHEWNFGSLDWSN